MVLDIWLVTDASDVVYGFLDIDIMIINLSICLSKCVWKLYIKLWKTKVIYSKLEIMNYLEMNTLKRYDCLFSKYNASEFYDCHL